MTEFEFVDKCVFFPEQGILAVGDLHVGYEHALRQRGFMVPETQMKDTIENFERVFSEIESQGKKVRKIVFLGDIKHFFNYEWKERYNFNKVLDFLRTKVDDKNIILIKGNHDTFDFSGKKMMDCHISRGIAFLHGHKNFPKAFDEKVEVVVMAHMHPSITLRDRQNVKQEKYKCFLVGKFKKKRVIIIPSFIGINEGTSINEEQYHDDDFSIVPYNSIKSFNVHAISENGEILDFGKVRDL